MSSPIYMEEHVGRVFGEVKVDEFSFFMVPLKNIFLKNLDIVVLEDPAFKGLSPILARIVDLSNREEITTSEKAVRTIAKCRVIGRVDLRFPEKAVPIEKLNYPVEPGSYVYLAKHDFIQDLLERDFKGYPIKRKVFLGFLSPPLTGEDGALHRLKFYLSLEDLTTQHTALISMTGFGKTYIATLLTEELAGKHGYPIFIVDVHNEFLGIGKRKPLNFVESLSAGELKDYNFNFKVKVYTSNPNNTLEFLNKVGGLNYDVERLAVSSSLLVDGEEVAYLLTENVEEFDIIIGLVNHITSTHADAVKQLKASSFSLVVAELARIVEGIEPIDLHTGIGKTTAANLLGRACILCHSFIFLGREDEHFLKNYRFSIDDELEKGVGSGYLLRIGFFPGELKSSTGELKPEFMVKENQVSIFDVSSLPENVRTRVVSYCLYKLYKARAKSEIPTFLLMVEDAETFASKFTVKPSNLILKRIASDGVKLGLTLLLLTQHPSVLDEKILSQIGIRIVGKILDKDDLETLKHQFKEEIREIPKLKKGEWLINGLQDYLLEQPVKVTLRETLTQKLKP
ncbi:MAG: ATP-binding protein [Candidatus Bathyarchaeota archaeon]|nr:ATP-binding protein [Candidatus Bathyarchaeota archaeon]